ncbi:MAG: hypothetical protein WA790_15330 [Sulfitobacter sp.]
MTTESDKQLTPNASELDPTSLAAIRDLLATEPEVKPQPVEERRAAKAEAAFAPLPDEVSRSPKQAAHIPRRVAKPNATKTPKHGSRKEDIVSKDGFITGAKAKVFNYRPTTKHIVFACLGSLIFFRPWLILGILFMSAFAITGIFLILGYDGFWRRAMGLARWYARRRPARSAELHRKLDSFAMKWDGVLDRFPEGSVDGLYLPDFGDLADVEARHDAALDRRFEGLRENGA